MTTVTFCVVLSQFRTVSKFDIYICVRKRTVQNKHIYDIYIQNNQTFLKTI